MDHEKMAAARAFLKDHIRMEIDFTQTDQYQGVAPPPFQKPHDPEAETIPLPKPGEWKGIEPIALEEAIRRRVSHRKFSSEPVTLDELSFLLWATQGIRQVYSAATALKTVPSAGARHSFETYLCVLNIAGLEPGIYRYLGTEHALVLESEGGTDLADRMNEGARGQKFCGQAAVTFIWTTIPYRMEWRYDLAAHKAIALDGGHVGQNLYLAVEAIGAGTCAIAAYDQDRMDALVGVDGTDEFVMYLSPVGKVPEGDAEE